MIKLYREEKSPAADAIEAEFKELVLGYDRVVVDEARAKELFAKRTLPVIANNERVVSGEEIRPYLEELAKLTQEWRLFQGDFCYVGDDGECL
ncbi:MAG: hypothetical protein LC099_10830 [Anaerolineales bacterium]|nr:hypothetical protein [Anaerolineales bacterium]